MTQDSAAKRREDVDEVAARVSFTVETTVLPSFARQRASYLRVGTARPLASHFSAARRREDVDEVAARGLMGAIRRGGGTVQSWVKPTEAAGGAEEAHRRWPEGRSEQGREQGKG